VLIADIDPHIDPELRRWYTYSPDTGKYYTTTKAHILLAREHESAHAPVLG
jgi:hypothetical protein